MLALIFFALSVDKIDHDYLWDYFKCKTEWMCPCVSYVDHHILFYLVLICMSVYLLRFSFQKLNSLRNHTQLVLYWSKLNFFVLFAFFYLRDCFFFNFFYYLLLIYLRDIVLNGKNTDLPRGVSKKEHTIW